MAESPLIQTVTKIRNTNFSVAMFACDIDFSRIGDFMSVKNINAILSVAGILGAPLLLGIIIGSTGPSIDTMKNSVLDASGNILRLEDTNPLVVFSATQAAVYSAIVAIGAIAGALLGGPLVGLCGFRWTMAFTVPLFLASSFIVFSSSVVWALYTARALTGIAVGINSFTVPTYISDIAPVCLRGYLGTCNHLFVAIGVLVVYLVGLVCRADGGFVFPQGSDDSTLIRPAPAGSFCDWRKMALFNVIPTIIFGVCLCFIVESPRWLAAHGKLDKAKKILRYLRGGVDRVPAAEEMALVDLVKKDDKMAGNARPSFSRQIIVGVFLMILQQLSGINAILFFCTSILRDAKMEHANQVAVYVMIEQVVVTFIACILVDKVGRKILLVIGASLMALACASFGVFFDSRDTVDLPYLIVPILYTYMAGFAIGVGPVPWVVMGEIFPDSIRTTASAIATIVNWLCAFLVTLSMNHAVEFMGYPGVMWCFGAVSVVLVFFTVLAIPETRKKSFASIQAAFTGVPDDYEAITSSDTGFKAKYGTAMTRGMHTDTYRYIFARDYGLNFDSITTI
jgi:sugar porter (SP) family MFS transporter